MFKLKLTQIGNSLGVILPKEIVARLKLKKSDEILMIEEAEGYRIAQHKPVFEAQMKVARKTMKRRRALLRELAK